MPSLTELQASIAHSEAVATAKHRQLHAERLKLKLEVDPEHHAKIDHLLVLQHAIDLETAYVLHCRFMIETAQPASFFKKIKAFFGK